MNWGARVRRAAGALLPEPTGDLSAASHARLLDMSFSRLRLSVYMMPVVALPVVIYLGAIPDAVWMQLWGLAYVLLSLTVYGGARLYQADQARLGDAELRARWLPRAHALALAHGAGLSLSGLAMAPVANVEASMLQVLVIAHIISTNATHHRTPPPTA